MAVLFTLAAVLLSSEAARAIIQDTVADLTVIFADNFLAFVSAVWVVSLLCLLYSLFPLHKMVATDDDSCFAGADADQIAMMNEECILLDQNDNVIGHDTKKNCHLNSRIFPEDSHEPSLLHRAFSVFLFNKKGELLMQKRAAEKITFPHFWANSCCSHPLYRPEELEGIEGAKRAAVRKIQQELGIDPSQLPLSSFHFLTRIYYKARSDATWGEHEIDYILFCTPPEDVTLNLNPNEVAEARYFSREQLDTFVRLSDDNGDLVSPWFRVIHALKLGEWWDAMLAGKLQDKVDLEKIHHWGMAGNTTKNFVAREEGVTSGSSTSLASSPASVVKKQGAYGKVPIHQHSLRSQLSHLDEVIAAIRLKYLSSALTPEGKLEGNPDQEYAVKMMNRTSRSFSAVTLQLPAELCLPVCVFYLTLRALDTVEDDMQSFTNVEEKTNHLWNFHKYLDQDGWTMDGVGEGDEQALLQSFDRIIRVYRTLKPEYQAIIQDITRRMGEGMAEFCHRDMRQGTQTMAEYNKYCFYVAGLVGEGLSALFSSSGLESSAVVQRKYLSHSMGQFLQKVNIIRDYLEDYVDGRSFWPATIWKKYASELGVLAEPFNDSQQLTGSEKKNRSLSSSLSCLNEMVLDALQHVEECVEYLRQIRNPRVFRFCAIPQVMAIATLAEVFNNPQVFTGVVKIRKGLAAKLILETSSIEDVESVFLEFARAIAAKSNPSDPNTKQILDLLSKIEVLTTSGTPPGLLPVRLQRVLNILSPALFFILLGYFFRRQKGREYLLPQLTETGDVVALALMFIVIAYMFGFLGIQFSQSLLSSPESHSEMAPAVRSKKTVN